MKTTNQEDREQEMAKTFFQVQHLLDQIKEQVGNIPCPDECTWGDVAKLRWARYRLMEILIELKQ